MCVLCNTSVGSIQKGERVEHRCELFDVLLKRLFMFGGQSTQDKGSIPRFSQSTFLFLFFLLGLLL